MTKRFKIVDTCEKTIKEYADINKGSYLGTRAITLINHKDDPKQIKALLDLAEYSLTNLTSIMSNTSMNGEIDDGIRAFLMQIGPWFQSFKNSTTMQEDGKEYHCFDHELYNKLRSVCEHLQPHSTKHK